MLRRDKVRHTHLILSMGTAVDVDFHQIVDLSTKSSLALHDSAISELEQPRLRRQKRRNKKSNRFNLFCEQNKGVLHFLTTFLCCHDQNVNGVGLKMERPIIDRESL